MKSHTREFEPLARPASAWDNAVIYQIYPRSFLEIRGEGEKPSGQGSLLGITERLDYLKSLQVDAIWLSPFFPSPLKDGGYDVSDYESVDPRYGDLADFRELVRCAGERGIKVMVDYVLNHTSDEHAWFQESRSNRDNPKADWYIWADPAEDDGPPNNWASVFSLENLKKRQAGQLDLPKGEPTPYNSAWAFDAVRKQYYLHSFGSFQPDLNWSNPEVRAAMKDVLRFWLDLGVDGFRVDAVNYIGKDMSLRDESASSNYQEGEDNPYERLEQYHSSNYPAALYDYLKELTAVLHEPKYISRDSRLVFEAYAGDDIINMLNAIDSDHASAFNFVRLDAKWDARTQEGLIDSYYRHLPADAVPN
ncbi:MAG TPA: alpha-amylase family glycosyl hydrolase, partial [Candidatus Saccharimonadales bacterium]|nr:alpha-amylase family glycosyl hydrolase [Candidatus Saccharimonadales bacterium]